jgi:cytochrome c-type biogenesis protein CcmE
MRPGAVLAALVIVGGLFAMVYAFLSNSSAYVDIAQARAMRGESMHLAGDIVPGTLFADVEKRQTRFKLRDEKGAEIQVVYEGQPPANMGSVTKVVAIGGVQGNDFHARDLLIKCPSKYESAPRGS